MLSVSTVLDRKTPRFDLVPCVIKAAVCLPEDEYRYFSNNLLLDHAFLNDYKDLMGNDGSSCHCIVVLGEHSDNGVLCDSEGYQYARYAAPFPGAKAYLHHQMEDIAKRLVNTIENESSGGKWSLDYDRFEAEEGFSLTRSTYLIELLKEKLQGRMEVRSINIGIESIEIGIDPTFCHRTENVLTQYDMQM